MIDPSSWIYGLIAKDYRVHVASLSSKYYNQVQSALTSDMDAMFVSVDAGGLFHNFEFIESLAHDTHPLIIANSIIVIELYRK